MCFAYSPPAAPYYAADFSCAFRSDLRLDGRGGEVSPNGVDCLGFGYPRKWRIGAKAAGRETYLA